MPWSLDKPQDLSQSGTVMGNSLVILTFLWKPFVDNFTVSVLVTQRKLLG